MGCGASKPPQESQGATKAEVYFFPDPDLPCRHYHFESGCRRGNSCKFSHANTSLVHLIKLLLHARQSIDVCVFTITCNDIAQALKQAHKDGVHVRIITDDDQATTQGSDAVDLKKGGIQVKTDDSPYHMHHKFCIIDGKTLVNGSFNWTRQAVLHNQENIVFVEDQRLIRPFRQKFEQMWKTFKNIKG
eukprot:TRINITY_DN26477_c0_g1_i1.p2 TRINITY_DN26477_c0_g1~~TRINITY_DN26477_c0_g1_i1.p2  ORF type:complete len:189 (+),score=18.27 TRINITY_DN26477_c0_g1_i1:150-716(+)